MPFSVAAVVTALGKAIIADRIRTTPSTYTTPPKYVALGTGATGAGRTAAVTDTALSSEQEARGLGTDSTATVTYAGDSYQVVGTQSITGTRAIDEVALFDAATNGNMFASATITPIPLVAGDSIQWTWTIQFL